MSHTRFADKLSALDQIINQAPTASGVAQFKHLVEDATLRQYAFDRLAEPDWIPVLAQAGFFQDPPEPIVNNAQHTVAFPVWTESRCLIRFAIRAPEEVLTVILSMPNTENSRVYEDVLQAALIMPPILSVQIVPQARRWCEARYGLLIPQTMGKFVAFLSQSGYTDEALTLAASLLRIMPDPRNVNNAETTEYRLPPEPHAGANTWAYQTILEQYVPNLTAYAGEQALTLLCTLLNDALYYSLHNPQEGGVEDYSYIWLPDIGSSYADHSHSLKSQLVKAVREAASQLITGDENRVEAVLTAFDIQRWNVYKRLTLYLLHRFPGITSRRVVAELLNKSNFDLYDCISECGALLEAQFGSLTSEQQERILKWIDDGPDSTGWEQRHIQYHGQPPTEAERMRTLQYWQYEWLQRFHTSLPPTWLPRYDALAAEFGVKAPFDLEFGEIFTDVASPKTLDELAAMRPVEIIDYLRTWQPVEDETGVASPTIRGLGQHIATLVESKAESFAPLGTALIGLEPTYIRSFLMGLREAVRQARTFEWQPVLELCAWTVRVLHPLASNDEDPAFLNRDPDIGWARGAVVDLLEAGCQGGTSEIPFSLRMYVHAALIPVTDDPDPTPEREARYKESDMDAPSLSLNTTRGKAMHALIRYALWVHRHLGQETGFEYMPEVRDVLARHLNPESDPSLAIRAVYGQWLPWLVMMDEHWTKANIARIFPRANNDYSYWTAAWKAYIIFCHASTPVFEILKEEYAEAIKRITATNTSDENARVSEADSHLAAHLMVLYWRGKITLDAPANILPLFYATAGNALRGYAMNFIGHSLNDTEEVISPDVIDRLKRLWMQRLVEAQSASDKTPYQGEIAAFEWWFASQKFEGRWALLQLLDALRLLVAMPPSTMSLFHSGQEVVQRLPVLLPEMPLAVLECLQLLMEADREGWNIQQWESEAYALIKQATQHADSEVQEAAITLADRFVARGFYGFRDLVGSSRNDPKPVIT